MCSIMSVLSAAPDPGRLRFTRLTVWGFCGLQSQTLAQNSHPYLRASLNGTVHAQDAVQTDCSVSGHMSTGGSDARSGCVHPLSRSSWRKLSSHEPHQVVCSFRCHFCKNIQCTDEHGFMLPPRVGKELCKRGHTFTVLVSDQDTISRRVLQQRTFPGLRVITFRGPPGVGSDDWAASMSRDPQVVWSKGTLCLSCQATIMQPSTL